MIIYGVALLSICTLAGLFIGDLLGAVLGVQSNVGGVGIAMIILIIFSNLSPPQLRMNKPSQAGVLFWSSMYIPIIVAMAAIQNVVAAVAAGPVALSAGILAVAAGFGMVPVLMTFSGKKKGS